jgi:hypothetical protein
VKAEMIHFQNLLPVEISEVLLVRNIHHHFKKMPQNRPTNQKNGHFGGKNERSQF